MWRTWIERTTFALGGVCLGWYCFVTAQAAAFQREQEQALTRVLSAERPEAPVGLVGRLEIPRLNMSVMVMEGDDSATLTRAAGHVPGTAGHRDTFFWPLRLVQTDDVIRLTSPHGTFTYRVVRVQIVGPADVSVIAPTDRAVLTLVTCYPFVYVGAAPDRFIVQAEQEETAHDD
jgi:sortase A